MIWWFKIILHHSTLFNDNASDLEEPMISTPRFTLNMVKASSAAARLVESPGGLLRPQWHQPVPRHQSSRGLQHPAAVGLLTADLGLNQMMLI